MHSVTSVIADSLPGNTKNRESTRAWTARARWVNSWVVGTWQEIGWIPPQRFQPLCSFLIVFLFFLSFFLSLGVNPWLFTLIYRTRFQKRYKKNYSCSSRISVEVACSGMRRASLGRCSDSVFNLRNEAEGMRINPSPSAPYRRCCCCTCCCSNTSSAANTAADCVRLNRPIRPDSQSLTVRERRPGDRESGDEPVTRLNRTMRPDSLSLTVRERRPGERASGDEPVTDVERNSLELVEDEKDISCKVVGECWCRLSHEGCRRKSGDFSRTGVPKIWSRTWHTHRCVMSHKSWYMMHVTRMNMSALKWCLAPMNVCCCAYHYVLSHLCLRPATHIMRHNVCVCIRFVEKVVSRLVQNSSRWNWASRI